jgi:hypothetical protein
MIVQKSNEPNCSCENSCRKDECRGKVFESLTLNECESEDYFDFPKYKVPVVISEFSVQIDTESKIKLPEEAIELKRIKKNVFLTQCRLIPGTKKVFLKGFTRKNIEYATKDCISKDGICGDIKHVTVHVPFHCIAELKCMRHPKFHVNPPAKEVVYFDEKTLGRNMKETDLFSEEWFNEKVYCELVSAKIFEADIVEEEKKIDCMPGEHLFDTFIEKEVLILTLKLLQKQQVCSSDLFQETECDSHMEDKGVHRRKL